MRIAVIGAGYVGLVTSVCFAECGYNVICIDVDKEKIKLLQKGIPPVYEPYLEELINNNLLKKRISFQDTYNCLKEKTDYCFIAVGTPMSEDGYVDLKYVQAAATEIGDNIRENIIIVNKSTVPVGTVEIVKDLISDRLVKRKKDISFDVISIPEFLRQGTAVHDCLHPERVVVGTDNKFLIDSIKDLYKPFVHDIQNIIFMDVKSAEMTKYASNCMLATKISFINEIANLCELTGADINYVKLGIGTDHRIGMHYINPGCGYGGSCLPKDIRALIKLGHNKKYTMELLESVHRINERQKRLLVDKILAEFCGTIEGKVFAVWGLAFKPNTDDMRNACSIDIINSITQNGGIVKAYDPKAINAAKMYYLKNTENLLFFEDKMETVTCADSLLILTEWEEFLQPDFEEIKNLMRKPIIFDGRNIYEYSSMITLGFKYYPIGGPHNA